ncbi:hypothetical protein FHC51_00545 [Leclercia sp. EC_58]|uniref:hypothetical protein n=1 Tax=Leclercia sp. EC_58 TaxID=2584090 RepID=UPI001C701138|nr:hypothetical protein [Leclercia sp. EC_58]MBW9398342.1 hypothetical protein [Leclercia sp. EC_58]
MNKKFGEIKTRRNILPSQAQEIIRKGTIDILIIQATASPKTKNILEQGGVTLYEGVEPDEVERLREVVARELETKEKKEGE